jgi:hypothetical protein
MCRAKNPHYAREFLKRERLSASLVNDTESEETGMHINPMHVPNCLVIGFDDDWMDESNPVKNDSMCRIV